MAEEVKKTVKSSKKVAKTNAILGTGRRKSSIARVRLMPNGKGQFVINGKHIDEYFALGTLKLVAMQALELTETKEEMLQVGTEYKAKPIERLTSKDGKKWKVDSGKIESIIVKKYEEENIYDIYYDKELTKVKLEFFENYY